MSAPPPGDGAIEAEWDALRLALLLEVATVAVPDGSARTWRALEVALTDAFDRPVPVRPVYRRLRTFARVRWPVLRAVLEGAVRVGDASTDGSAERAEEASGDASLAALLDEATVLLAVAARARGRHDDDALEREVALLRRLLGEDADPGDR